MAAVADEVVSVPDTAPGAARARARPTARSTLLLLPEIVYRIREVAGELCMVMWIEAGKKPGHQKQGQHFYCLRHQRRPKTARVMQQAAAAGVEQEVVEPARE